MRVLGILPARSGSKGIKNKNLRLLLGKPLLSWPARALADARGIDIKICSTDSQDIAKVAIQSGLEVPFLRPADLATDDSGVIDAIQHALRWFEERGDVFSHVVLVQATSPTVNSADIENGLKIIREDHADSVVTAVEVPPHFHPAVLFEGSIDARVSWLMGNAETSRRRQDWSRYLARVGLLYIFSVNDILERGVLWGDKICYLEVNQYRAINIDLEEDLTRAEQFFSTNRGAL